MSAQPHEEEPLIAQLGVRVRVIEDLDEDWLYFTKKKILLVDALMGPEDLECAMDRVLHHLFETSDG